MQGPSGSGKTSLLRALVRASPLHEADILWDGQKLTPQNVVSFRAQVHYLSQKPPVPEGSVEEFLRYPLSLRAHQARTWNPKSARSLMEEMQLTDIELTRSLDSISGGELQRLYLIRSLLLRPRVLILDEPTSSLDERTTRATLQSLFVHVPEAILFASHLQGNTLREELPTTWTYTSRKMEAKR